MLTLSLWMRQTFFASLSMGSITEPFAIIADGTNKVDKWEIKCIVAVDVLKNGIMEMKLVTPIVTMIEDAESGGEEKITIEDFMI